MTLRPLLFTASLSLMVVACGGNPGSTLTDQAKAGQANGHGTGGGNSGNHGNPHNGSAPAVRVLSNRADLISGDDALLEIVLPQGTTADTLAITVNGAAGHWDGSVVSPQRYLARLTGLALGDNLVSATVGGSAATLTITNHPNSGPVFSGPQVPWTCQGSAVDTGCNQPAEFTLLYKSTDRSKAGLQPYDPENPPTDIATTTTQDGETLPFIVRQELGYQARDQYKILTLYRPGEAWQPWAPQAQWNHKILITHGGSCGTDHKPGGAPLDDYSGTIPSNPAFEQSYIVALGQGFAVMSTALDNLGHNCNLVTAAEALMMAKEHLIEQYGEVRYTIGTGCSGGSITQQHVANAYPGIYDGLITTCAYPDALSTGAQFADFHIMRWYFEDPSKWGAGIAWTPEQFAQVEGHISHVDAVAADEAFFKSVTDPTNCDGGIPAEHRYHPTLNPSGVRCGLMDYMINVLGARPQQVWSPMEQAAGRGFGGFFAANDGIQYGLQALQAGQITPAQFVDLNTKVGGLDIDFKHSDQRLQGDPESIRQAYLSGGVNSTNNMNQVAIINSTGPDPGIAHDVVHAWWTRWRLDREFGNHDNYVMWGGPAPLIGDPNYMVQSLAAMDRWLAAVVADTSSRSRAEKIVADKPADIHDQCSDGAGHKVLDTVCPEAMQGRFKTPRQIAGGPITDDVMKCQLRPLNRADYTFVANGVDTGVAIPFTDAQWAQLQELFAAGVCDYSKPGVNQQGTIPWRDYSKAPGVTYSGTFTPPPAPQRPYPSCDPTGQYCFGDIPVAGNVIKGELDQIYDQVTGGGSLPGGGLPGGGTPGTGGLPLPGENPLAATLQPAIDLVRSCGDTPLGSLQGFGYSFCGDAAQPFADSLQACNNDPAGCPAYLTTVCNKYAANDPSGFSKAFCGIVSGITGD